ncbi:MAG: hypothetical protein ACJARS_001804 [bacterium]|jgi:hypothetical protein
MQHLPISQALPWSVSVDAEFTTVEVRGALANVSDAWIGSDGIAPLGRAGTGRWVARSGLPDPLSGALWSEDSQIVDRDLWLEQAGFSTKAREAHRRMFARLRTERASLVGILGVAGRDKPSAWFSADKVVDAGVDLAAHAEQLALAARLVGAAPRQLQWLMSALPALAPRPTNVISAVFSVTRAGLAPWLRIRLPDVPIAVVMQLYRQFSLLDEGAATRLGRLAAVSEIEQDVVSSLEIEVGGADGPRFAVTLALPESDQ